jgi:hypothetical protein
MGTVSLRRNPYGTFDSLVEFLCSTALPGRKYTDINRSLLKHALQNSGNVIVLMDGFDEISSDHKPGARSYCPSV